MLGYDLSSVLIGKEVKAMEEEWEEDEWNEDEEMDDEDEEWWGYRVHQYL